MTGSVTEYMADLGVRARCASRELSRCDTGKKNAALENIAGFLLERSGFLQSENLKDLDAGRARGLEEAMLDRLTLKDKSISAMAEGLRQVAALPDPIGEITGLTYRPSGIQVGRMLVPMGVIGIIYESRPNVTADAAALCLKSGNACILRGGSEAIHSNRAIADCIRQGLEAAGITPNAVQIVATADRTAVGEMLRMNRHIDIIIPRGGKGLIERIMAESSITVIKHLDGNCHVYIDDHCDLDKAVAVAVNAKTQRYGVCNAMETLLVHRRIAPIVLPMLAEHYRQHGVEMRGCDETRSILSDAVAATEEDWDTEYLAPVLAIRIVTDIDEAIDHISRHGSAHTDIIVTEDYSRARRFLREVDSSSVMVNA